MQKLSRQDAKNSRIFIRNIRKRGMPHMLAQTNTLFRAVNNIHEQSTQKDTGCCGGCGGGATGAAAGCGGDAGGCVGGATHGAAGGRSRFSSHDPCFQDRNSVAGAARAGGDWRGWRGWRAGGDVSLDSTKLIFPCAMNMPLGRRATLGRRVFIAFGPILAMCAMRTHEERKREQ